MSPLLPPTRPLNCKMPDGCVCAMTNSASCISILSILPMTILLRDNDVKYPPAFDEVFRDAGVTVPKMPPRGGPDAALSVWVVQQQEVKGRRSPFKPSCSFVTQTSKAMSGPPRESSASNRSRGPP